MLRFFLTLCPLLVSARVAHKDAENNALLNSPKLRKSRTHNHGASFNQHHRHEGKTGVAGLARYHSSERIFSLIEDAKKTCKLPMKTEWVEDSQGEGSLFVVRLGQPELKKKMLIVSNEHARELFGAEISLRLIQFVCESLPASSLLEDSTNSMFSKADALTVLENVQYVLVPIVNVKGRQLVESKAEPCQRSTTDDEGSVDLNRNMEVDWGKGSPQSWGTKPFSTYQARILRDIAAKDQFLGYVDLHTGAWSLMTSWGFREATDPDFADQQKVLDIVKKKHCPECDIGSNRLVIGYENPGEVIDHMYAIAKIKYTSLWETYDGDTVNCVEQFNAPDSEYDKSVNNWASALLTYGQYIHTSVSEDERSNPGAMDQGLVEQSAETMARGTTASKQKTRLEDTEDRLLTT